VRGSGALLPARSRNSPEVAAGAKTIEPSGHQAPPRSRLASASSIGRPPSTATLLSLPGEKKATHRPSGEKKGLLARSVPSR
jgi:hypothetical protein